MKRVLYALDAKTAEFARHPFYAFLRDEEVDSRQRLAFAPALAHFVMTFADIYALVLREEPAKDKYQELVNAHTYEDGGHWKWFLADLVKLGADPRLRLSEALRVLWSDATAKSRMLSYHICHLSLGADSLRKLVLVQCIEATGAVTLKHVAPIGSELARLTGKNLVYFGPHHSDTESDHTMEQEGVKGMLTDVELGEDTARELIELVARSFALFTAAADEMLAFARAAVPLAPCA
jgi:hypothetical protein